MNEQMLKQELPDEMLPCLRQFTAAGAILAELLDKRLLAKEPAIAQRIANALTCGGSLDVIFSIGHFAGVRVDVVAGDARQTVCTFAAPPDKAN